MFWYINGLGEKRHNNNIYVEIYDEDEIWFTKVQVIASFNYACANIEIGADKPIIMIIVNAKYTQNK